MAEERLWRLRAFGRLPDDATRHLEQVGVVLRWSTGLGSTVPGGVLAEPTKHSFYIKALDANDAVARVRPVLETLTACSSTTNCRCCSRTSPASTGARSGSRSSSPQRITCAHLGRHPAVMRGPACGDLALSIVVREGRYVVRMAGTWTLEVPRP